MQAQYILSLEKVGKLFPTFLTDLNSVKKTFKALKDISMRIQKEYKPSGSAWGVPIVPKWQYFKNLLYVAPFLLHRKTKGNREFDLVPETPIEEESAATEEAEYIEAGMSEWLDHLTLVHRVPGSKPPLDLSKCVRREVASYL